jgi:hypothetical protein
MPTTIEETCMYVKVCPTMKGKPNNETINYSFTPVSKNAKVDPVKDKDCNIVPICVDTTPVVQKFQNVSK